MTTVDLAQARADAQAALSATARLCEDDVTARMSAANVRYCRADVPTLAAHIEALVGEIERLQGMVQLRDDALDLCQSGAVTHVSMTGPELRAALGWTADGGGDE